jgi:hypothetical protein
MAYVPWIYLHIRHDNRLAKMSVPCNGAGRKSNLHRKGQDATNFAPKWSTCIILPILLNIYLFIWFTSTRASIAKSPPPHHNTDLPWNGQDRYYTISYAHTRSSNRARNMRLKSKLTQLGLFLEAAETNNWHLISNICNSIEKTIYIVPIKN